MEELVTWEGTVHSIIFENAENGYTVLRLLTGEGEVVTVVGCIPCAAPGEHLTVSGVWETHPQHGEQLRARRRFSTTSPPVCARALAPPPPGASWTVLAPRPWTFWSRTRVG